jgi:glucosamine-6-phosphate deaminase
MSRLAAGEVIATVRAKPDAVLVLPTGNTPVGMCRCLVEAAKAGEVDFGTVRFVTLDEYAGIPADDRRRLYAWLERGLLEPLAIPADRIVAFDTQADAAAECRRIEDAIIALGGVDLAVLGIGPNGHIGFNEPGSDFASRAREIALAPDSIASNAAYWGSEQDVPRTALTLGIGTLCESRAVVVIASGQSKADIVARMLAGPVGPEVPATAVRAHPNAKLIADAEALAVYEKSAAGSA